jgi:hypothetical protein
VVRFLGVAELIDPEGNGSKAVIGMGWDDVEVGGVMTVQIRYHHEPAAAALTPREGGAVEVRFDAPQPAVTPGQLAVFYDGERVLGGATIRSALDPGGRPLAEEPAARTGLPVLR